MKPNLILLHGAIGSAAQMQLLADILSEHFTCHLVNFGGHGGEKPGPLSITRLSGELAAYIQHHQLQPAAIFGYSMGGYVALNTALHLPQLVGRIMTYGTLLDWNPERAAKEITLLNPETLKQKVPKFADKLAKVHGEDNWEDLLRHTSDMLLAMGQQPPISLLSMQAIEQPVKLCVGDRDAVSIKETEDVYRMLPVGCMSVLPNSPHPLEKVDHQLLAFEIKHFFLQ
jgi:pimeloyl-ACP methyl ester carboxylesterase